MEERRLTITRRVGRAVLENLLADEAKRRQIEEAENVQARLVTACDSRRTGLEPDDHAPVAADIANEDEDLPEIYAGAGQRIKRGRLVLEKPADVAAFAKTVHHIESWTETERHFDELREGGSLEE